MKKKKRNKRKEIENNRFGTYYYILYRKANIKDDRRELQVVRGFSTVPSISLINVEGTGMMGVPGIANRIFGALKEVHVCFINPFFTFNLYLILLLYL